MACIAIFYAVVFPVRRAKINVVADVYDANPGRRCPNMYSVNSLCNIRNVILKSAYLCSHRQKNCL